MDPTTLTTTTFTVTSPGLTSVLGTVTYDASNDTAIFTPASSLAVSTTFTGEITTGTKSEAGIPLGNNFIWTFVTGAGADAVAPIVLSTNPSNLGTGVPTNQSITAVFSEAMDSTTITGATFTLTDPSSNPVAGTVTYSAVGATATFSPTNPLSATGLYTATITTGATDLTGNALATDLYVDFHDRDGAGHQRADDNADHACRGRHRRGSERGDQRNLQQGDESFDT